MSKAIDPHKIVIFSGAGISAESGLATFRDNHGLWNRYKVSEVATPAAWKSNPELVLQFYNERRSQIVAASPNLAHLAIVELESKYEVVVMTQNIDEKIIINLEIESKPFGYTCWRERATIGVPSVVQRWLQRVDVARLSDVGMSQ